MGIVEDKPAPRLPAGRPPNTTGLTSHIVDAWYSDYLRRQDEHVRTSGTEYWASRAGMCLRRLQYHVLGCEPTDEVTVADAWRFEMGHTVHDLVQQALSAREDLTVDHEVSYTFTITDDVHGIARGDSLVSNHDGHTAVVEIKSIGSYAFKLAAVGMKGKGPEGPKYSHIRQLALEVAAAVENGVEVDEGRIIYVCPELISPREAKRLDLSEAGRFCAEWVIPADELLAQGTNEKHRMLVVHGETKANRYIERIIPEYSLAGQRCVVTNPDDGTYFVYDEADNVLNMGNYWGCSYCPFQQLCAGSPPSGAIELGP